MADEKATAKPTAAATAQPTAAEKKLGSVLPMPFEDPDSGLTHAEREPERVIPSKGDDGYDTPSGHALAKVGAPDPLDAGSDKERERGLAYLYEKMKKRWGIG
jgi:hypothetical protein